jgi:antitoxin VapB
LTARLVRPALRAIAEAIRKRFGALVNPKNKASIDEILAIAGRVSANVKRPYLDHSELLYDEEGLPK